MTRDLALLVALIGAGGVLLGAVMAVLGTLVSEVAQNRRARQQWLHDRRIEAYGEYLAALNATRLEHMDAHKDKRAPESRVARRLESGQAVAALLATDSVIEASRVITKLVDNDYTSAILASERSRHPAARLVNGTEPRMTPAREWCAAWDRLFDALRGDLGLDAPSVRLTPELDNGGSQ